MPAMASRISVIGVPPWIAWIGCARRRSGDRARRGRGRGGRCRAPAARRGSGRCGGPGAWRRASRRLSSSVRRRSNSSRRAAGSRWRAKATRSVKARSSLTSGSDSSSTRRARPVSVMPYTFLPRPVPFTRPLSRTRARKAASSPASEPVIGALGHGGALLDGLHAALGLEAGEGGVERAEADRGAAGEQLTEPLLELVAVELLLREQAEDGEVDHEGVGRGATSG